MLRIVIAFLALLIAFPAVADDKADLSASRIAPGCEKLIQTNGTGVSADDAYAIGRCVGMLIVLHDMGPALHVFCTPKPTSINQLAKVVMKFIDAYPERLHETFDVLAFEGLAASFPCK